MAISAERAKEYEDYYNWLLLQRDYQIHSAKEAITSIAHLFDFLREQGYIHLTAEGYNAFILFKKESGCKNNYLRHYWVHARVYTRYCIDRGLPHDPTIFEVRKLKAEPVVKTTLSDDEIEVFLSLEAPKVRGLNVKAYQVWTVFFSILAFTGMRPSEVAHLTVDDVDFGRGVFILRRTKTGHVRYVPIAPNIRSTVQEYIQSCHNLLFPSKQGGTSHGSGVAVVDSVDWGYNFKKRIERMEIKRKGLTPYSFRHSFITRLLEEDVNLFKVQKIVGHSRISTTAMYTHLTTKDIQKAIIKHPLILKSVNPVEMLTSLKEIIRTFGFDTSVFEIRESNKSVSVELRS